MFIRMTESQPRPHGLALEEFQRKQDALQNTRTLAAAMQSPERIAPKRTLIVALSGIVGVMLGLILVMLSAFLAQVKKQQVSSLTS